MTRWRDVAAADRQLVGNGTPEEDWDTWPGWSAAKPFVLAEYLRPGARLVVVAPHPDDETLGSGGLIRIATQAGHAVLVLAVTAGGGSHPGSTEWPRERLIRTRRNERDSALSELACGPVDVIELDIPDGQVRRHIPALSTALLGELRADDLVIAPWRYDGHPDHEAVGGTTASLARVTGARCLQVPIWGWHWATPREGQVPTDRLLALPLDPGTSAAKRRAVRRFASQLEPDRSTGATAILPDFALRRWLRNREAYLR